MISFAHLLLTSPEFAANKMVSCQDDREEEDSDGDGAAFLASSRAEGRCYRAVFVVAVVVATSAAGKSLGGLRRQEQGLGPRVNIEVRLLLLTVAVESVFVVVVLLFEFKGRRR